MSAAGCSGAASAEIDEATAPAWELPASPSWSAGLDTSIRSAATSVSVLSAGGRPCAGRGEGDTQHLRLAHENDALRERLRQLERQLGHDRAGPAAVPSGGASAGAEPAEPTRHALPPRHAALGGAHEPLPGAPAAGKPTPLGSTDGAGAVPALDMTYRSSPPRAAYPQELDALGASGLRRVAATVAQAAAEAAAGSASLEGTPRTELPALGPRFPLWSAKQDMPTEGEEGRSMLKAPLHELQDPSWQPEPLDLPGGRRARAAGPPEGCAAEAAAAGAAGQQQHHPEGCPESSSARAACAEEGLAVTDGSAAPAPPALQALRSCLQRQRQGCAAPPHGRQPEGDEDAERAKAVRRRKHNKIPGASRGASEKPPAARAHFAAYAEVYAPLVPSPRSAAMATPTLPSAACASPSAPPREEPRAAQPPAWDTPAPASGQHSPLAAAQLEAQAWDKVLLASSLQVGPSTPDAARGLAAAAGRAAPECPVEAQPLTEASLEANTLESRRAARAGVGVAQAGPAPFVLTPPRTGLRDLPAGACEVRRGAPAGLHGVASVVQVQPPGPPGRWAPCPSMARSRSQGRPFTEAVVAEDSWAAVALDRSQVMSRTRSQPDVAGPPPARALASPRGVASCCAPATRGERLLEAPSGVSSSVSSVRLGLRRSSPSSARGIAPGEGLSAQVVLQSPRTTIPRVPPPVAVGQASARGSAVRHQSAPPDGGRQAAAAQSLVVPPGVAAAPGAGQAAGALATGPPPPVALATLLAVPSPAKVALGRTSLGRLAPGLLGQKDCGAAAGTTSPRQTCSLTAPIYAPAGPQAAHVNYSPKPLHVNYVQAAGARWPQPVSVVPVRPWGACSNC